MLAKTEETPRPEAPEEKRRTVTLTDDQPVSILESEWPVIAEGSHHDEECDRGLSSLKIDFRVRHGKYNRYLIHGKYDWYTETGGEPDGDIVRVGKLLSFNDDKDLGKALREVGAAMKVRVLNEYMHRWVTKALDDCFAHLPTQIL